MPKKRVTDVKKTRKLPKRAAHDKKRVDGVFANPKLAKVPRKKKITTTATKKKIVKRKKKISRKTKPTYQVMIKRALQALNNRNGSSMFAIFRHLEENYPVPGDSFHRYVSAALKKGVADGVFSRVRASYKLTSKGKSKIGKAKKSSKKSSSSESDDDEGASKKRKRSSSTTKKDKKKKDSKKKKEPTKKKARSDSKGKEKEKEKEKEKKSTKRTPPKKTTETSSSSSSSSSKKYVSPAGHKFRWQYMDGSWKDYEMNASDLVENAYQVYIKNPGMCDVRSVKSGQWHYQVDFLNLKQTNIQHESHTTRSIRRVPIDE